MDSATINQNKHHSKMSFVRLNFGFGKQTILIEISVYCSE